MEWDWFEVERSWLSRQKNMADWKVGVRVLTDWLAQWARAYTARLCAASILPGDPKQEPFCRRLWRCWSHHWRHEIGPECATMVDGIEIATARQAGSGSGGTHLGGDPFADVVLAEAVVQGDRRAWAGFETRFRSFCRTQATRFIANVDRVDSDWWADLMTHLCVTVPAGALVRPFEARGALARFEGQSILEPWLKSVARNFFCDRVRQGGNRPKVIEPQQLDDLERGSGQEGVAEFNELESMCRARIRQALAALTPADQILVRSGPGRTMSNRHAAALLRISEGQTSRRRQDAMARFLPILQERFPEPEYATIVTALSENIDQWIDGVEP